MFIMQCCMQTRSYRAKQRNACHAHNQCTRQDRKQRHDTRTEYTRYQTLADLQAEQDQAAASGGLPARKTDDDDLAAVQLPFFLTRYLTRDGVYDKKRQLGEAWAEAAQRVDLDPFPHFAEADQWQAKTEALVALFIVLSLSLLLLTLAGALDPIRKFLRYSTAILGTLLMLLSVVAMLWIERG